MVEGLDGGRTALIIKLHHALSDGVAGVAEFAGLFDLEASPGPVEVPPQPEPAGPLPSAIDMLTRSSSELLRRPGAILEAIGSSLERLAGRVDEVMGASEGSGAPSHGAGLAPTPDRPVRDDQPRSPLREAPPEPAGGEGRPVATAGR